MTRRQRRPRRTLRRRLTLVYSLLFVALAATLLAVMYGLARSGATSVRVDQFGPVPKPLVGPSFRPLEPSPPAQTDFNRLALFSVIALAISVLISVAMGWFVADRSLRPLRGIITSARAISASNLHERVSVEGRDAELRELGETLNDLFGRLEASFESQRRFVANASHELRTPLTAERTLLQVALADPHATAESLRATCEALLSLGDQQAQLIDALLTLATSERGLERSERFDLATTTELVVDARRAQAEALGLVIEVRAHRAEVDGDAHLVEAMVGNLVDNAVHHNVDGGRVDVSTVTVDGRATIVVRNTGPLVPPDQLARLFEPFEQLGDERVRQPDRHGLGLAIVQAIAHAHGADVTARARADGGLDVEVTFPAASEPADSTPDGARVPR